MKYTININQLGLKDDKEISITDASVLCWIHDFCGSNSKKINLNKIDGWFLIRPQYLVDDMPLLRIKTRSGGIKLLRRLNELGYIELKTESQKTYIKTTEKMDRLWFDTDNSRTQDVDYSIEDGDSRTQKCSPQDTYHNTNTNTNYNTNQGIVNDTEEKKVIITGQLPITRGKNYISRLLSIYSELFNNLYGFRPTINIPRFSKNFKELVTVKTELQISAMMIVFFNWAGITGSDEFEKNKLIKAQHNISWFFSTVNSYEAYLRNVMEINFDDENEVRKFVAEYMLKLKE